MKYTLPIASADELGGMKVGEDFEISKDGVLNIKGMDQMQNTVQQLVDNVGTGKALVAEAITEKGVDTAEDATFQEMAGNIGQISVGVDKEYVDNADIEVKRTSAKAHSTKYDETVIPAQYANKLYVYDHPESMYKASETGVEGAGYYTSLQYISAAYDGGSVEWWTSMNGELPDDDHISYFMIRSAYSATAYQYAVICADDSGIMPSTYGAVSDSNFIKVVQWAADHSNIFYGLLYQQSSSTPFEYDEPDRYDSITYMSPPDVFVVEPNVPIFDVDAGFEALENYITTGDYSGAVNAGDLAPLARNRFAAIDVNTGDWYNIINNKWRKQGTLDLNSSGGGSNYTERVIYTNTNVDTLPSTITLSSPYTNFDMIVVEISFLYSGRTYYIEHMITKTNLDQALTNNDWFELARSGSDAYLFGQLTSTTTFENCYGSCAVHNIRGIKF